MSRTRKSRSNRTAKNSYSRTKKAHLESLEPKQLLDASGLFATFEVEDASQAQIDLSVTEAAASREIVFIDSAVEDHAALTADISSSAEIVMLDADRDGIEQIAEILSSRSDISAIHIVSHGDQAELRLGNATLTADSMAGEHADELATIRAALSDSADILIYGCDFGQGEAGLDAAEQLAERTGADVAASDDLTGAADRGGDWDLELNVGSIEAQSFEALAFSGLLTSQNEVLTTVLFDGTTFDTDPLDDGSGNGVHTPGLDGGENNNVVKTFDNFAVRIDWNVNEDLSLIHI